MKKNSIIAFLAAASMLAAVSCEVQERCDGCGGSRVSVQLGGSIPVVTTRVAGATEAQETAVSGVQLYVFSSSDGKFVERYDSPAGRFEFYLPNSTYDFLAFVNCPELPANPSTRADLEKVVTRLEDNAAGNFQMWGSLDRRVIQKDEQFTVEVKRLVAKVTYVVRVNMKSAALAAIPFHVKGVYMTNVCGENTYALDGAPQSAGVWFDKRNYDQSRVSDALLASGAMDVVVPQGDSIQTGHTFYPYPNPWPDPEDRSGWSTRRTRFVVKADIGGTTTYYPVTIPGVERNKHYQIDLTITGWGVEDPEDIPGTSYLAEVGITVADWDDGGKIEATY